uniref:Proteasome assembly chaperone family protein n=1 Tax=Ignisphaera aggregans TaxID=334771 RepID=A0A7C2ZRD2_9CREN
MWFYKKIGEIPRDAEQIIAILGFPGMGLVGKVVTDYIKTYLEAKAVARIYGYGFPAHLLSYDKGDADIMHVEISYAKRGNTGILLITSEIQPMNDTSQQSLARYIVRKLLRLGVKELIATAAYVSDTTSHARNVYVVGTNDQTISKYIRYGAQPLSGGVISGLNGIVVGWAKFYGLNSVCLLGESWKSIVEMNYVDYTAAKMIIDVINKVWNFNINTSELDQRGLSVEVQVKSLIDQYLHGKDVAQQEKRPYYIT